MIIASIYCLASVASAVQYRSNSQTWGPPVHAANQEITAGSFQNPNEFTYSSTYEDPDDAWQFTGTNPDDILEFVDKVMGRESDDSNGEGKRRGPTESKDGICKMWQLPSLLYIGEGHAASTSLAQQMNQHPRLSYGQRKEHQFFASPNSYTNTHATHDLEEYKEEFLLNCSCTNCVTFDASMAYLHMASPDFPPSQVLGNLPGPATVEGVKQIVGGKAKIMVMIRDPVDVLNSIGQLAGHDTFHLCAADSLEVWLKYFPRNQVLFLDFNDYARHPRGVLDKVFEFANVGPYKVDNDKLQAQEGRRRMGKSINHEFRLKFWQDKAHKQCKHRLEAMTGLKFDWVGASSDE